MAKEPIVRREVQATRTEGQISIDGILDEEAWQKADVATDFIQNRPNPGEPSTERTEVYLLYDDVAIYVGAKLYDDEPHKVLKEFTERDQDGNYDWFGVTIDTYQDGQNAFGFGISAAGTQNDWRMTASGDDDSWDAVWDSRVVHTDEGWFVEMAIPFSMLRFSNKESQTWRINFGRSLKKNGEVAYWNPVRPDINGFVLQAGIMSGLESIRSPIRLMLTPYIVSYLNESHHKSQNINSSWGGDITGGLDLKMGISKAFTLDAILIPDFGQVQADDQVLNLSPFEVFFSENRQFFTEGIELFSKSGLFYSRRIGGRPILYNDVYDRINDGETVVYNPATAPLLNATKVTGRTASGTGIGFFNAIENETFARIRTESGDERMVLSGPRTNYNLMVVDQNLPNAGFVTLTNTNVMREGGTYDANVSGVRFQLRDSRQRYSLSGAANYNLKRGYEYEEDGYSYNLGFEKISGNFTYSLNYLVESRDYDINDLGFLRIANRRRITLRGAYNWFEPFGPFQSANIRFFSFFLMLQEPSVYSEHFSEIEGSFLFLNQSRIGWQIFGEFIKSHDYYEPRTSDFSLYFLEPRNINFGLEWDSDPRKAFRYGAEFDYRKYFTEGRHRIQFQSYLTYQLNNHFTASWSMNNYNGFLDVGFVNNYNDGVILGNRDQRIIENTINLKYAFTNTLSTNLRIRHYWTQVTYASFGDLQQDGTLAETDYQGFRNDGTSIHDFTVDFFNTDLRIIWRYAPGSDLSFVWKQAISEVNDRALGNYFTNLADLGTFAQTNSFSIRLNYFLDYASIARQLRKK